MSFHKFLRIEKKGVFWCYLFWITKKTPFVVLIHFSSLFSALHKLPPLFLKVTFLKASTMKGFLKFYVFLETFFKNSILDISKMSKTEDLKKLLEKTSKIENRSHISILIYLMNLYKKISKKQHILIYKWVWQIFLNN